MAVTEGVVRSVVRKVSVALRLALLSVTAVAVGQLVGAVGWNDTGMLTEVAPGTTNVFCWAGAWA